MLALVAVVLVAGGTMGVLSASAVAATCGGGTDNYMPGGGNWNVTANWSEGTPTGTEVACWDSGDTVTVTDTEVVDSIQADGNLDIDSGGTLGLSSATDQSSIGDLSLDGELDGPGGQTLTVTGAFDWGGSATASSPLNAAVGSDLAIDSGALTIDGSGSSAPAFDGGSINTGSGTVSITNPAFQTSGSPTLTTTGTITMGSGVDVGGSGGSFSAAGISGGGGTYGFGSNHLTLTGGTTTVASATELAAGTLTLDGGTLDGTGDVDAAVTNTSGTVSPGSGSPGTLDITGTYSQAAGAALAIEISSSISFSQLAVSGAATLAGDLTLSGAYTPTQGNSFEVLTYASESGTLTVGGTDESSYAPEYGASGLTLAIIPADCPGSNYDAYTGASGNWNVAGNWSKGAVPTSTEVACWPAGTTVTVSDGESADSIQAGGGLDIPTGGNLGLTSTSASSTVDDLSLEGGGTLNGGSGQTLTVSGTFDWGSSGSGPAVLNPSGGLAIHTTALTIDGSASTPDFEGGSINAGSSVVSITNPNFTISGSPSLTTTSTIAMGSGVDIGGSGGSFSAAGITGGGGTYGFGSNHLTLTGGTTTVASATTLAAGTLTLTGATLDGTGDVDAVVTNTSGTVSPGSGSPGTLDITGTYSQGASATLAIEISSSTSFSQLAVSGAATLAGDLTLSGAYTPTQGNSFEVLTYASKTGTVAVGGTDESSYLADYGTTGLTLAVTPTSCPTTGTYDAYTGASGNWNVAGNWSTGAVPSGTEVACWPAGTTVTVSDGESVDSIQAGGGLDIATGAVLDLTSSTDQSSVSALAMAGGEIDGSSSQTITTTALSDTGTSSVVDVGVDVTAGTPGTISGTLTLASLNTAATTSLPVTGALTVDKGTIDGTISGAGTFTTGGTTTIASGGGLSTATVDVGTGTLTVASGASYAAATATTIATGTLTLDASASTGSLSLTSPGALTGSTGITLTVSGAFQWTSGTVSPDGGTVATTGTVTLGSGALTAGTAGSFSAGGVAESGVTGSYGFGTSNLTLTGGTTTVASANTLTSGPLTITGGTLQDDGTVSAATTLTGGTLDGTGKVTGSVTNTSGTVSPGNAAPGTLTVTGNYAQGGSATLAVEIDGTSAGSGFGDLAVSGTATLGGDLSVTDENGFIPGLSDTFKVLTSGGARSGAVTLTGASRGVYELKLDANDVTLTANPVPSNTQAPTVTGTPSVGQTLTCSQGIWSAAPTAYTYQWNRDGSPIGGATNTTYVVSSADSGHALTCTVTASNSFGSGTAVSAGLSVPAPPGAPIPPFNITAPAVSGSPTPGNQLSCSTGDWLESPTGYVYVWERNGSPIAGATAATYRVQIVDEGQALTCVVTAFNAGGAGGSKASSAVIVAEAGTLTCAKPTGKLSGRTLGPLQLGFTRARARRAVKHYKAVGSSEDDFCLYGGWGINAGYPSTKLLGTVARGKRSGLKGRIALALTSNPYYALDGVRPGTALTAVPKKLHLGKVIRIGANSWYIAPGSGSRGVLRVRGGIIQEVGIAIDAFTNTRTAQTRFLKDFNSA
jgi:fibronectin-binding autotransporter adhesin